MHQQHNQIGVVNKQEKALFKTSVSRIRYLRHRGKFAAHTPDRLDAATAVWAWCRAIIEAILYPKKSCIRRDTPFPRAPAEHSDRCRIKPYLRHHGTFAARTPERLDAVTVALTWCRASIEAIIYPKRSSTRRDTQVVSACTCSMVVSPRRGPQHVDVDFYGGGETHGNPRADCRSSM